MKNSRLLLIFILALAAVGLTAQNALPRFVDTTTATYIAVAPEYSGTYPTGAGNLTTRWEVRAYTSTDAVIDPLDTNGMPTGDDVYLSSQPLNFSAGTAPRPLNLQALSIVPGVYPCYAYLRIFNSIQGTTPTKHMSFLAPYHVTAAGPVNVTIIPDFGWAPWVPISNILPTYTVNMTTIPAGYITPTTLGPTTDPTTIYGTYTPTPLPAPATGYWTPANLVIDASTVWTPDGPNFVLNQEFVWTETTQLYTTYTLHVNGPDGYAVTGPVAGVTDYIATDGPSQNNVNDLLGDYTIAAAPAGWHWQLNPIPVTEAMFMPVGPAGKSAAGNSRNGSKADVYQYFEATIEFVLIENPPVPCLTVVSTPAGAAIIKDGVDTGQVTPYTFCPGEAGVYTVTLPGCWLWAPESYTIPTLTADLTIEFIGTECPPPDTWTLCVQSLPGQGYAIFKNGIDTGQTTDHCCTGSTPEDLYGTYTLAAVPGYHWEPAEYVIDASTAWAKYNWQYTVVFNLVENPPAGFTFEVNAFCLAWYDANGYIFEPPYDTNTPAFLDPNDVNAEIWYDNDINDLIDPVFTGVYTPYIFGAPGNLPFLTGMYYVQHPDYTDWIPQNVIYDVINNDYFLDFLGSPCVPVELSSFTATLTAQNYVQLTWVSQTESQMMGYLVYRSTTNNPAAAEMIDQPMIPATNTSTAQTYTVTDTDVQIGSTYYYWLEAIDYNASTYHGPVSVIVEGEVPPVLPEITSMRNAYPNPFAANGSTNIEVSLKAGENGTVTIYNVLGQTVRTFSVNEGNHMINWNGRDSKGNACGSGIYFYKLSTPSMNVTKKMVIVK